MIKFAYFPLRDSTKLENLHIPKSKFDVSDIKKSYSQNIQNLKEMYLLDFSIQRYWKKSLKKFYECFYWSQGLNRQGKGQAVHGS